MKKTTTPAAKTSKVNNGKKSAAPVKKPTRIEVELDEEELDEIEEVLEGGDDEDGVEGGKCARIIALHISGLKNKEIIELGFNKSTVYRQVGEFKKLQKAPALSYLGFDLYEARIRSTMQRFKMSREKAVAKLAEIDNATIEEGAAHIKQVRAEKKAAPAAKKGSAVVAKKGKK
jgi:hypothetical protein